MSINEFGLRFGLDIGFDSYLRINVAEANNYQFPEKVLIDNYRIARFSVPVFPGIVIPGSVDISLKADLALNLALEKAIDINMYYSKHIQFSLPFEYSNGKMSYPNPSNLVNIYGTSNLNPDFSQFKQIPKLSAVFTLTPELAVKWPDFGLKNPAMYSLKERPAWLQRSVQKRGVFDSAVKFLQLVLTNQLPLIATGSLTACTSKCGAPKPLEVSVQANVGNYQAGFSGLGFEKYFNIPIKLTTPSYAVCLPFINVCKSNKYTQK